MAGDPRIRGEHEDKRYADWDRAGSSPHTRGARAHRLLKPSGVCIIPAYAGSTTSSPTRWRRPKDHPRIRGEHSSWSLTPFTISGSSPHTRGAQRMPGSGFALAGIIPAYAGSTPAPTPSAAGAGDHPRIRGEHADQVAKTRFGRGSSPHTRGARRRQRRKRGAVGIIPAYAGSTNPKQVRTNLSQDHPRIRGEHKKPGKGVKMPLGSSPHTRGARRPMVPRQSACRIIPAYAGSTRSARR